MRRFLRIALGTVMILYGLIGVVVGVVAILDPAGTKMADDGDPFGKPPSVQSSMAIVAGHAAVGLVGAALVIGRRRDRGD